jgi:predicted phage terminase large subunit-like protein
MNSLQIQLGEEFSALIDMNNPKKLRDFFGRFESLEELAIKVVLWGHYFLPKYFSKPTPEFHYELIRRFFSLKNEYTACPRGFGKTTIMQLCICYAAANALDEFIVLIEKTFTEATEVLEAVRDEFSYNDVLLWCYGDLKKISPRGEIQDNLKDSAGDFFINGVRLRAKGFDSPIRGLKSRHTRPTRILLDDVESDEHIENPEQRRKYLDNYLRGIVPAAALEGGNVKMYGTILHDDSLLKTLIDSHQGAIYKAWDDKRELLWSSFWTVDLLEQKRKEMGITGRGDAAFYQEYFNEPVSEEDQIFRVDMFRRFNKFQLDEIKKRAHNIYIMVDPAISKKQTADFTAIVVALVDAQGRIYVLEIIRGRFDPMELMRYLFALYEKHRPIKVGIETVAYQKALVYMIDDHRKRSPALAGLQVQEIRADTDKVRKIKGLQPKYEMGLVYHNTDEPNTSILEQELLRFPRGSTDDVADALASIIQMITAPARATHEKYKKWNSNNLHTQVRY